jgi:hypothetical protein
MKEDRHMAMKPDAMLIPAIAPMLSASSFEEQSSVEVVGEAEDSKKVKWSITTGGDFIVTVFISLDESFWFIYFSNKTDI